MKSLLITNARLVFADHLQTGSLLVRKGRIEDVFFGSPPPALLRGAEPLDAQGAYVGPGMVDIHCHGAAGHDFATADTGGCAEALRHHLHAGTTSLVCTFITSPVDQMSRATEILSTASRAGGLPSNYAGLHFEGPYLSPEKPGMHRTDWMHDPEPKEYTKWIESARGDVRIFTIAPERNGVPDFCRFLKEKGVVISSGHSRTDIDTYRRIMAYGLEHFVHANNAMDWPTRSTNAQGWLQTFPNTVGSLLSCDAFTTEIIADGYHVHPDLIRLIVRAKGSDRVALVSDASPLLGKPEGTYEVCGFPVMVRPERLCTLADGSSLASSVSTLWQTVQNMVQRWGFGVVEAWKMGSAVPSRIARLPDRGRIEVGCRADLLIVSEDLRIREVICAGLVL